MPRMGTIHIAYQPMSSGSTAIIYLSSSALQTSFSHPALPTAPSMPTFTPASITTLLGGSNGSRSTWRLLISSDCSRTQPLPASLAAPYPRPLLLYGYPYSPIPIPSTVYKVRDTSALPSGISETTGSFLQLLCPTWGPFHSSTLSTPLILPVSNPGPANLLFTHFTSGFFSTTCSPFRLSKSTFWASKSTETTERQPRRNATTMSCRASELSG